MNRYFFAFLLVFKIGYPDQIVNPITDVCWECLFPITISGVTVTPGYEDLTNHDNIFCSCCGSPPEAGLPLTFWEPTRLVDVTMQPYRLVALGGTQIGPETIKGRGAIGVSKSGKNSFYHVHWYVFPVLTFLGLFTDFSCLDQEAFDVGYISELDPLWNDEEWSFVINPEAALFSNSIAHLSCIPDCAKSSFSKPFDSLFWCGGCQGSLYPFTGFVGHHVGPIQASSLLVHRLIAKIHRAGLIRGYPDGEFCESQYMPLIKKSLYKTQLVYPMANSTCPALGKTDIIWGSGKSYPYKGEEFVYLIWKKKQCCIDAVKPALKHLAGEL